MTQNTALAAGQTAATSSDIVVAAGSVVNVYLFTDRSDGVIPTVPEYGVYLATPGTNSKQVDLGKCSGKSFQFAGPGTLRVIRPDITAYGVNVGVGYES